MEFVGGGTSEGGGEPGGVCLICHTKDFGLSQEPTTFFAKRPSSSSVLSKHLSVYFLLRHVLELPSEQLVKYLRHCPNPENWVKICSSCDKNYVEKCWRVFEEFLEVKRRFAGARHDLIQAVKRSLEVEDFLNIGKDNDFEEFIFDIDSETRRFVGQREYFQPPERSTSSSRHFTRSKGSKAVEIQSERNATRAINTLPLGGRDIQPITTSRLGVKQSISEIFPNECEIKEEPTSPKSDTGRMTNPNVEEGSSWKDNDEFCEGLVAGGSILSGSEHSDDTSSEEDWNPEEDISVSSDDDDDDVLEEIQSSTKTFSGSNENDEASASSVVKESTCPLCKTIASSRDSLFQHISGCQDDQIVNLKCDHCEDKFISKPVYLNHLGLAHGIMDHLQFQCDIPGCGRAFSREDFLSKHSSEVHIPRVSVLPEGLTCKICGKSFKVRIYYEQHMELHELHGKDLFQCKICGKNCGESYYLRRHMATAHNPTRKRNRASLSIQKKYKHQMHLLQFQPKCDLCSKTFLTKGALRKHQILIHKTNFYECSKCDWKSSSVEPYILKDHMMRHHGTEEELKALTCPTCGKTLSSKQYLDMHMSICRSSKIVCEHCGKEFLTESSHLNHLGAAHGIKDNLKFKCTFEGCGKSFCRKRDLRNHGIAHKTPEHECSVCGIKFTRKDLLRRHMLSHKPEAKKAYQCELCPASYARKDNLMAHIKKGIHHQNPRQFNRTNYKCSECELTFGWKSQVESHLEKIHGGKGAAVNVREATGEKAPTPKKRVRKKRTPRNKVIDPDNRFHCEHCGKVFQTKAQYLSHTNRVHGNKDDFKFVCSFEGCGKKCFTKFQLGEHEDKHKDPSHKCVECGKMFSQLSSLLNHKKRIHREKREEAVEDQGKRRRLEVDINCEECNLTFAHPKGLRKHNKIVHGRETHKKQESFQCELCETKFSTKPSLQHHVKAVHERKWEVFCDLCGKILRNRHYLKKHNARVHNIGVQDFPKLICTVEGCSKSFGCESTRKLHILNVHEGRRPFQCEECGKEVMSRTHLKRHIQAMHSESRVSKPFKCEECGKGFAIREYLWLHKKTHEKKESGNESKDMFQL